MTERGVVKAVDGVSFSLVPGETLAVVGESGSGKSMTGLSIMGLLPEPAGYIARGSIRLRRRDGFALHVETASDEELRSIRGDDVAMIFQEPMTALNPVYRIGDQIDRGHPPAPRHHEEGSAPAGRQRPRQGRHSRSATRIDAFPHELSGGMCQRAMIAMALALNLPCSSPTNRRQRSTWFRHRSSNWLRSPVTHQRSTIGDDLHHP
ncbi:MAG: ATP-binding cassette domain-containing protein [Geminicoccaceae bacterium]